MRGIQRYTIAALCALGLATPALALPQSPSQRVQLFASCLGTLHAVADQSAHRSDKTQTLIAHFEALLDATLPDALAYGMPESMMWQWRVAAQQGHGLMLIQAHYGADTYAAAQAKHATAASLAACQKVVPKA